MLFENQLYTFSDQIGENSLAKTDDGFLRCKCRIMRTGALSYPLIDREDGVNYGGISSKDMKTFGNVIVSKVEKEDLTEEESLKTLEGIPILAYEHNWVDPDNIKRYSVGNVSGVPTIEVGEDGNTYIVCEALITDQNTIKDIETRKLQETSAGYKANSVVVPDEDYSCKQVNLRYNHILFCEKGSGRAGRSVRIFNCNNYQSVEAEEEKVFILEEKKMVRVPFKGKILNVDEADVNKAEELFAENATELEDKDSALKERDAKIEELQSQLLAAMQKVEELEALSEGRAEEKAGEMLEDAGDAEDIVEYVTNDEQEKNQFMNSIRKTYGMPLYTKVMEKAGSPITTTSIGEARAAFKAVASMCKSRRKHYNSQKFSNSVSSGVPPYGRPVGEDVYDSSKMLNSQQSSKAEKRVIYRTY